MSSNLQPIREENAKISEISVEDQNRPLTFLEHAVVLPGTVHNDSDSYPANLKSNYEPWPPSMILTTLHDDEAHFSGTLCAQLKRLKDPTLWQDSVARKQQFPGNSHLENEIIPYQFAEDPSNLRGEIFLIVYFIIHIVTTFVSINGQKRIKENNQSPLQRNMCI